MHERERERLDQHAGVSNTDEMALLRIEIRNRSRFLRLYRYRLAIVDLNCKRIPKLSRRHASWIVMVKFTRMLRKRCYADCGALSPLSRYRERCDTENDAGTDHSPHTAILTLRRAAGAYDNVSMAHISRLRNETPAPVSVETSLAVPCDARLIGLTAQ